jgi:hypothetical protein
MITTVWLIVVPFAWYIAGSYYTSVRIKVNGDSENKIRIGHPARPGKRERHSLQGTFRAMNGCFREGSLHRPRTVRGPPGNQDRHTRPDCPVQSRVFPCATPGLLLCGYYRSSMSFAAGLHFDKIYAGSQTVDFARRRPEPRAGVHDLPTKRGHGASNRPGDAKVSNGRPRTMRKLKS